MKKSLIQLLLLLVSSVVVNAQINPTTQIKAGSTTVAQVLVTDTLVGSPTRGFLVYKSLATEILRITSQLPSGGGSAVASVNGETGTVVLDKIDIGLSNVDNTSDINKPVSTAQAASIATKQPTLVAGTNLKTINGVSLLGPGDMVISGGGTIDATPTDASSNAVSSNGVFDALVLKVPTAVYPSKGSLPAGGGSGSIITIPVGSNGQVLTANSAASSGMEWATPSASSAIVKYTGSVTGSAGIICKIFGTAGVTVTKTNSSTITFVVPAGGYIQNYQLFYPSGENPGSNATHVFQYTSNTTTNQGNSTADAPNLIGWFASGLPTDIYHARSVGSSSDFVTAITAISSGNISILTTFGTTGLSSGDIILKGSF